MENKKRIIYFDKLRILSAFLVIINHVSAQYWNSAPVESSQWQFMNVYDIIGMASVPIFFMLSGALMLNPQKETNFRKILFRVLSFVIIYHLWLLFYNLVSFALGERSMEEFSIKDIIYRVLNGQGIYHLWFLPELTLLYLISPVLKEAFRSKKICEYFLILYFIAGIIFPSYFLFDFPLKTILESMHERSSLVMLTGYIGYFVAGHYIYEFVDLKNTKKNKCIAFFAIVLGYSTTILIDSIDALKKGEASTLANTPFDISISIAAVSIFILFKMLDHEIDIKKQKMLSTVSGLTFGIYLFHPFIITIFMKLGMNTMVPHTAIMVPVFTTLIFAVSGAIIFIIKKIPVLNYLIK